MSTSFDLRKIKILQAEITSDCNARCPQCPRNYYGGRTVENLPVTRWNTQELGNMFSMKFVEQLETVYMCGTYGDPMMHPDIVEIVDWFQQVNPKIKIGLHTNGSLGKLTTYKQLAERKVFIAFGIDGLEDTNHLYRRRVKWSHVMERAKQFIDCGGRAFWDFIVFRHNQHQVSSARKLANTLGFSSFNVKKTSRFLNRKHQYQSSQGVLNSYGKEEYKIFPPTLAEYINTEAESIHDTSLLDTTEISCNAKKIGEIYVAADGMVFPCGWLHDRMYGPHIETHSDHIKMLEVIERVGKENTNCRTATIESIVDGPWFKHISESWKDHTRYERCAVMCGNCINPIGTQNAEISYKK